MISSEHSFKNGKNQVTKKTSQHGNILNEGKKNFSMVKLSSWPRERIYLKLSIFQLQCVYWKRGQLENEKQSDGRTETIDFNILKSNQSIEWQSYEAFISK